MAYDCKLLPAAAKYFTAHSLNASVQTYLLLLLVLYKSFCFVLTMEHICMKNNIGFQNRVHKIVLIKTCCQFVEKLLFYPEVDTAMRRLYFYASIVVLFYINMKNTHLF